MEIKIGPDMVLHLEDAMPDIGIYIAADVVSASAIANLASKIYFKVDNGPPLWGHPGQINYPPDMEDLKKADSHMAWRLAQHERRYWQAGFPVFVGVDHPDYKYEVELTEKQSQEISKQFL
jgi:hypothetical protein